MKIALAVLVLVFSAFGVQAQVGSAALDSNISNKDKYDKRRQELIDRIENLSRGIGRANCCNGRSQFYDQDNGVCRDARTGAVMSLCAGTSAHTSDTTPADGTSKAAIGNTLDYQAQMRKLLQMKQAVTVLGIVKNNVTCCSTSQTFFSAPDACIDPVTNAVSRPACLKTN